MDNDRRSILVKESSHDYSVSNLADSPERAAALFNAVFDCSNRPEEHFWMMTLDGARRVSGMFEVTVGTLMSSLVHPREIFIRAIAMHAASIIVCHNHPSGMLDVSEQDREVTKRLRQAGELLGVRLDDHIIIACCSDFEFISAF